MPSVTIILPNLNHLQWLPERVATIKNQTFEDWECLIIDGYSTDGSVEFFNDLTKADTRFRLYQFPPAGVYDAWNKGIELAKGDYIYIATSDDTMSPQFLSVMIDALDRHSDCNVAHCCLTIIDELGNPLKNQWKNWDKIKFYGNLINEEHVRVAPFDGLMHAGWSTVYTSITQLLIRKPLFDQIGLFSTNFGNIADYEWGVRVGFSSNVVHVPMYIATWRKHPSQLTSGKEYRQSVEYYESLVEMSKHALSKLKDVNYDTPKVADFCANYYYALMLLHMLDADKKWAWYFLTLAKSRNKPAWRLLLKLLKGKKLSFSRRLFRPTESVEVLMGKYNVSRSSFLLKESDS